MAIHRAVSTMSISTGLLAGGLLVPAVLPSAVAATPNPTPAAGARKSATQLHYGLSATASASVDVATGNVLVTDHYSPCRASHRVFRGDRVELKHRRQLDPVGPNRGHRQWLGDHRFD